MIEIRGISKRFAGLDALNKITLSMPAGEVFGLVGTNGAGKSTLLRLIAGVLRPDEGEILIDGEPVWEREEVKAKIALIPDDAYFFPNASAVGMAEFYASARPAFDRARFDDLLRRFGLDGARPVRTYSKGMRKQLAVILGLASGAQILLCDETFDGLDPVMRQAVKSLFAGEMVERGLTPVIASHMHRIQCVVPDKQKEQRLLEAISPVQTRRQGALLVLTVRGVREEILRRVDEAEPAYSEVLPLTLEEIFIGETEAIGYEVRDILA